MNVLAAGEAANLLEQYRGMMVGYLSLPGKADDTDPRKPDRNDTGKDTTKPR